MSYILQYDDRMTEASDGDFTLEERYFPLLQPLQFAKGWKEIPKGFMAITELEFCDKKDCESTSGNPRYNSYEYSVYIYIYLKSMQL